MHAAALRPVAVALCLSPLFSTAVVAAESTPNYLRQMAARWKELSPADLVRPGLPPTIVFHGTGDTTTPFAGAKKFQEALRPPVRLRSSCFCFYERPGVSSSPREVRRLISVARFNLEWLTDGRDSLAAMVAH